MCTAYSLLSVQLMRRVKSYQSKIAFRKNIYILTKFVVSACGVKESLFKVYISSIHPLAKLQLKFLNHLCTPSANRFQTKIVYFVVILKCSILTYPYIVYSRTNILKFDTISRLQRRKILI